MLQAFVNTPIGCAKKQRWLHEISRELADAIYEDVLALVADPTRVATRVTEGGQGNGVGEAAEKVYDAHQKAGKRYVRTETRLPDKAIVCVLATSPFTSDP